MNKQRREGEGGAPHQIPAIKKPGSASYADPKVSQRKGIRKLSVR